MTRYYLRLEIVRMLRNMQYLVLAIAAPIGFYLLFATLFGDQPTGPGQLPSRVEIMVAMAAFGVMWAVLSATGPRVAQERVGGWLEYLRATPMASAKVVVAKVVASVALALPAITLVCATAVIAKGVDLSLTTWAELVGVLWLGAIPFSALGITIGFAANADGAFALSYGVYLALSAIGGLWVPPPMLPASLRQVADVLPSYQLADLGWRIAAGHGPRVASIAILLAWTVGLALLALVLYGRPVRSSRRTASVTA